MRTSSLLLVALLGFSGAVNAAVEKFNGVTVNEEKILILQGKNNKDSRYYRVDKATDELSGIKSTEDFSPTIMGNQYTVIAENDSKLTVNGEIDITTVINSAKNDYNKGTYLLTVLNNSVMTLNGDIDIEVTYDVPIDKQPQSIGNNIFYARDEGSKITIGAPGTQTKAWAIAYKPDVVSVKQGATIEVLSTNNQFIGSIDMLDSKVGSEFKTDTFSATFAGEGSYWIGDEQSWMNVVAAEDDGGTNI